MILVDAGPMIALIHADDNEHRRCREVFAIMNESLGTVWPAVAEAMHLLSFSWQAQEALWEMIETGAVEIMPLGVDDVPRMKELMRKCRDLPMDLAAAGLVRVAESESGCGAFSRSIAATFKSIVLLGLADSQSSRPADW